MNGRSMIRMFFGVLLFASMYSFVSAATLDEIKKAGVLRVAVMQDDAPFGSIGTDMTSLGFDIDLANAIASKLGVKAEMVPVTGQNRIPYLLTGKVDLIIADLGKTPEREKQIDYTNPYALTFNGVFGDPKIDVKKPADLVGHTVSSARGGSEDIQLTQLAPQGTVIKRFEDINGTLQAYASGQVDFFAMGSATVAPFAKRSPRPFSIKFHMEDEPDYIGVGKGNAGLLAQVNTILADMKKDGSLSNLSQKWLNEPLPKGF